MGWLLNRGVSFHSSLQLFWDFFHCPLNRGWQLLSTFKIGGCLVAVQLYFKAVADPDLQMRGWGVHPDPEVRGGGTGGCVKKNFFSALWASVWSKNKGVPRPPRVPPLDSSLV